MKSSRRANPRRLFSPLLLSLCIGVVNYTILYFFFKYLSFFWSWAKSELVSLTRRRQVEKRGKLKQRYKYRQVSLSLEGRF